MRIPEWSLFLFGVCLAGCTELGDISAGVCGNGVVEGSEDCDGSQGCGPAGKDGACRFVCESDDECKTGWHCGKDAICREPSGGFERSPALISADSQIRVKVGDFDGDGFDDVLSVGQSGRLEVHYFEQGGQVATKAFQSEPFSPAVGKLTADSDGKLDSTDDIAHLGGFSVGVLETSTKRDFAPVAYAPIPVSETDSRFLIFDARPPSDIKQDEDDRFFGGSEILQITGTSLRSIVDKTVLTASLPISVLDIVPSVERGDPPIGRFDEGATRCDQFVLVGAQSAKLYLISPCNGDGWNNGLTKSYPPIELPSLPVKGLETALAADLNGDGHLDIVIGSANLEVNPLGAERHEIFAAFGNGDGTFKDDMGAGGTANKAVRLSVDKGKPFFPAVPLAAGDLNSDGRADFVFPGGIALSESCAPDPGCFASLGNENGEYFRAIVADVNKDDLNDVVAISENTREVAFLNGTGLGLYNLSRIPTLGFPTFINVGDYDGDLVLDVAVIETEQFGARGSGVKSSEVLSLPKDKLSILFGKLQGAPEAPVSMGKIGQVLGLASGHLLFKGLDTAADVGVLALGSDFSLSVALFGGATDRQLQSPFELTDGLDSQPDLTFALQIGRFAGEDHPDLAALSITYSAAAAASGPLPARLWLAPSTGMAELSAATNQATPLAGIDIDPCTTQLAQLDLDANGSDELVLLGRPRQAGGKGGRVQVARAENGAWKFDPLVKVDGARFTNERIARTTCRYIELGGVGKPGIADFLDDGTVQVADADASGVPDVMAFSVSSNFTSALELGEVKFSLALFKDGAFDAPLMLSLPSDSFIQGAVLVNVDTDPELELIVATEFGEYQYEVDFQTGELKDKKLVADSGFGPVPGPVFAGPLAPYDVLSRTIAGVVTGDFNGDRLPDFAVARPDHLVVYYGKPVKQ
ncbi:MAG: VCBS repeat-containing protein [Myxococcales bacterium]|nr:VCBS repeat-containing protein [Myxococcales bacterium]